MKTFYVAYLFNILGTQSSAFESDEKTNLRAVKCDNKEIMFSSKINFSEEIFENNIDLINYIFPLKKEDYPITSFVLYNLLLLSDAVSIVLPDDYDSSQSIKEMIEKIGGEPYHAPSPKFWSEFEEVIDMQITRRNYGDDLANTIIPWFPLPKLWSSFTINEIATSFHADSLGFWQMKLILQFLGEGLSIDNSIIPKQIESEFIQKEIMLSELNSWAISTVSPIIFGCKYYVGRARPEEVAWQITKKNGVQCSTPDKITNKILGMNLTKMEDFTALEYGAPVHPSWPAMHSAVSTMSIWLPVVSNLEVHQMEESKVMDLAISMGRTLAGVHYTSDNIAGLKVGQEVVAKELPRYLATLFGADPEKVRNKIEKLRFDWEEEALRLMVRESVALQS